MYGLLGLTARGNSKVFQAPRKDTNHLVAVKQQIERSGFDSYIQVSDSQHKSRIQRGPRFPRERIVMPCLGIQKDRCLGWIQCKFASNCKLLQDHRPQR